MDINNKNMQTQRINEYKLHEDEEASDEGSTSGGRDLESGGAAA
jgi:hypothetical protein